MLDGTAFEEIRTPVVLVRHRSVCGNFPDLFVLLAHEVSIRVEHSESSWYNTSMNIQEAVQVLIDSQLAQGIEYEKVLNDLTLEVNRLERLEDTVWCEKNPLTESEKWLVEGVDIRTAISAFRDRNKTSIRRGYRAVQLYREYLAAKADESNRRFDALILENSIS